MNEARSKAFEAIAQKILKHLKSNVRYDETFLPRPFFLEFTGTPSSAGRSRSYPPY